MKFCRISTHEEYLNFLSFTREGANEFKSLLDLLTVGETFFFRNRAQFDGIKEYVIPKSRQVNVAKMKIWCAGCSTGEEPYTLAIVLRECAPSLPFSIIATDINRRSLAAAKAGVYTERSIRNVEPEQLRKYFRKVGDEYYISDEIKNSVQFAYHNLASNEFSHPDMQSLDILLCRNVTIYFDEKTLKRVISNFVSCLSPGGLLLIGHAETLRGISNAFHLVQRPNTIIYEKKAQASGAKLQQSVFAKWEQEKKQGKGKSKGSQQKNSENGNEEESFVELARAALGKKRYADAMVFVDKHLVRYPKDSGALMIKGEILGNQRVFHEALTFLDRAIENDNLSTGAYCLKGTLLADMGKYTEALPQFKRVLYLDPDNCISHYHLGNMYRLLGETSNAEREYKSCNMLLRHFKGDEALPLADGVKAAHLDKLVEHALRELKGQEG
ncbi:MAG: CheR family methyltransferase [Nitrospinota bacterium]